MVGFGKMGDVVLIYREFLVMHRVRLKADFSEVGGFCLGVLRFWI